MEKEQLKEILEKHKKWINNEEGGKRADLYRANLIEADLYKANLIGADLRRAYLRGANLIEANLRGTDLIEANLIEANLYGANLIGANLIGANLRGANLIEADLRRAYLRGANLIEAGLHKANLIEANLIEANLYGANLCGANLRGADLIEADLRGVIYDENTAMYALACPEKGAFTGYKRARSYIVELEITADAKRSSATTRKCRCSKAKVLNITNIDGSECGISEVASDRDIDFIYRVGETVEVTDFDDCRWNECSTGIHFFITRDEAVRYR